MEAISIILPVFNVEKYIAKCLTSILDQTFKNFEIIIIDDCGDDNSITLCKRILLNSDINYKIIYNETNQGISESRNIGIENAKADYIIFIDSDDWINPQMLEKLYNASIKKNADLVTCNVYLYSEESDTFQEMRNINKGAYAAKDYLNHYFNNKTNYELWGKLIKKELLLNIKFPNKVIFEDILTLPYIIKKANKVLHLNDRLYFYVQRIAKTSITGSRPTNIEGFLLHLGKLKNDFKSQSNPTGLYSVNFVYKNLLVITYILIIYSNKYSEIKSDLKSLSNFIKLKDTISSRNNMRLKHVLYLTLLQHNNYLFYLSYKVVILKRFSIK